MKRTEHQSLQYDEVLTPEELALFLKCGRTTAFKLLRSGAIRSFTIGRRRYIRRRDAEIFIEERLSVAAQRVAQANQEGA